jgi:SAM-dependent methyltransferase
MGLLRQYFFHSSLLSSHKPSRPVTRFWSSNAKDWIAWAGPPHLDFFFWSFNLPCFLDFIGDISGKVLEIGCGEGRFTAGLLATHPSIQIEASDSSADLVQGAVRRNLGPHATFSVADAASLPYPGETFDSAVAMMVLHDVDQAELACHELARCLRDGGSLFAAIINPDHSKSLAGEGESYRDFAGSKDAGTPLMSIHRTLEWWRQTLEAVGLSEFRTAVPQPSANAVAEHPDLVDQYEKPLYLYFSARKHDS